MNLPNIYESLTAGRKPFLDRAEEVSKISLPDLNVNGPMVSSKSADLQATTRPYSNAAAHAIGRLATNLQALVVPPSTNWFMLDLPVDVKLTLKMAEAQGQVQPGSVEGIQSLAREAETLVLEKMAEHDLYGKIGDAFRRLLVEGQVLFHVTAEFIRTVPLRCFVVQRFNGNVEKLVIKEEYSRDGEDYDLYTLVDYKTGNHHQLVLSPSIIKASFAMKAASMLTGTANPEQELRTHPEFQRCMAYFPFEEAVIVSDTGTSWRNEHGFAREGGAEFLTWRKESGA